MKLPHGWADYTKNPRIVGSALTLAVVAVVAWLIAPGENKVFNFVLLFSALGALSVAVFNLWASQSESLRRPRILLGIENAENLRCRLSPKWRPESERALSDPVSIRIAMRNSGNRTAGQVLYNVVLPKETKNAMASFYVGGIHLGTPKEQNVLRYVYTRRDLLPGPVDTQEIQLAFLPGNRNYEGYFVVHVDEEAPYRQDFVIEVRHEDPSSTNGPIEVVTVTDDEKTP